jgi:hypothetical protein
MEFPKVAPTPVRDHAVVRRALVDHYGQCRHVQRYLTGNDHLAQQPYGKHRPLYPGGCQHTRLGV